MKQKKKLVESLVYKNTNKLNKVNTPGSGENFKIMNNNIDVGIPATPLGMKRKKEDDAFSYASYCSWFLNRFCKSFFVDAEAKKKREMLAETLGLNNYLMHLDYIDRQIVLEQHVGDINQKIEEIINKYNEKDSNNFDENNADNTGIELQKDLKRTQLSLIDAPNENDMDKHLTEQI